MMHSSRGRIAHRIYSLKELCRMTERRSEMTDTRAHDECDRVTFTTILTQMVNSEERTRIFFFVYTIVAYFISLNF